MKKLFVTAALALTGCMPEMTVLDGDTIVYHGEHIRLNGIDAPEMPGHCRRGRHCVAGDPYASRATLAATLEGSDVLIDRLKQDRYGRTVAEITANGVDVSCEQIRRGQAIYKPQWDERGTTAKACGL